MSMHARLKITLVELEQCVAMKLSMKEYLDISFSFLEQLHHES